jgi:hypothetical protein
MAIEIILDGNTSSAVKELHDLEVLASVERGNVSANITTEQLTLVNEYAKLVRDYIAGGANGSTNGIFEGLPLQIQKNGVNVFRGYLDFLNDFEIVDSTTVKARIKKREGNNNFQDRASGLTFGFLVDEGVINQSDYVWMPYIVEKEFDFIQFSFISFMIYNLVKDLKRLITQITYDAGVIAGDLAGGVTGAIGAFVMSLAVIAVNAAIAILMLAALFELLFELVSYLISPIKYHRAMIVKTLMEKASLYLGYSYNTSIKDMNKIVLLPSKTGIDKDQQQIKLISGITIYQPGEGIPSVSDFGYTFGELLDAMNTTFRAEYTIENGVLEHHVENSPFWVQQSGYTLPDILQESIVTNANELISDKIILFKSDLSDSNSLENFLGTTYEIRTRPITFSQQRNILMNGFEKVEIPYALGNRKNGLNKFENFVKKLLRKVDNFIILFGGFSNSSALISNRTGYLKLQSDFVTVPKLMRVVGTINDIKLPLNNRAKWSAKYLYEKYHNSGSFVLNNFGNQYYIYKSVKVPFGFEDFNQLSQNSYFYNQNGDICKLEKISWNVSKDFALIDYRVQRKYTLNLVESYIEES